MAAAGTERSLPNMPTLPAATWDVVATLADELRVVLDRLGVIGAIETQRSRLARAIVARALAAGPADDALVVRARVVVAEDATRAARADHEPRLVVEVPPGTLVADNAPFPNASARRGARSGTGRRDGSARRPRPRSRPRPAVRP